MEWFGRQPNWFFLIKVHVVCSVIVKENVRASLAWLVTNVTDAKKISMILVLKDVDLVDAVLLVAWATNRVATRRQAVVRARTMSKASAVTVANLVTLIWTLKICLAARLVSVMVIHQSANQLLATLVDWRRAFLPGPMKNGWPSNNLETGR